MSDAAAAPLTDRSPAWFELTVVGGAGALAGSGLVGLVLALAGEYRTWAALLGGAAVAAGAVAAHRAVLRADCVASGAKGVTPAPRSAQRAAVAVLVLVGAAVVFAASTPSQNLVVTRDPGSYLNTAVWMVRTGGLDLPADQGVFGDIPDLRYEGAAVYQTEDGDLEFQFNHLASVPMAIAYDLGGHRLLFRVPALGVGLGLLALYAVTVRVTRRPWASVLAPTLMALSMPMLFVGRNTYSEPFTIGMLWAAVLMLATLHDRPRVATGAVGGVLMGALVAVRVDALLYVALLAPLAAVSLGAANDREQFRARARSWATLVVVGVAVGLIGWYDLVDRSGRYVSDLAPQLRQLRLAVAAAVLVSLVGLVVWRRVEPLRSAWNRWHRPVANAAAVVVVVVLAALWLVRPLVQQTVTGTPFPAVAELQRRAGLPIEADRTYHEFSLWWMAWYLGVPAVAAALVGMGWSARRFLLGRAGAWGAAVLALGAASGALYWWNPSITPDHLWAMRRFVPAVLPSLAVFVAVAAVVIWDRLADLLERSSLGERVPPVRIGLGVIGVGLLVVPPALTTAPVVRQRDQNGYVLPVLDACGMVGEDAALIVVGGRASITLPQTLRSWCGVPAAGQGDAFGRELAPLSTGTIAAELAEEGRQLYLVAEEAANLDGFLVPGGPVPQGTRGVDDRWAHVARLDGPPNEYRGLTGPSAVPSPFRLYLLRVDPAPAPADEPVDAPAMTDDPSAGQ